MLSVATIIAAGAAASYKCPGSSAFMYASCEVTTKVSGSCEQAVVEITARLLGLDGWTDPHNQGHYQLVSNTSSRIDGKRTTGGAPHTPGKHYTDKFILTLSPVDSNTCKISACSESQSTSALDFSTNYCNIRNLYCGTSSGCIPVRFDFTMSDKKFGTCLQHDKSECIAKKTVREEVDSSNKGLIKSDYKCPKSHHDVHASCEVTAHANATCSNVMAEIRARANGTSGWVDPHHNGTYALSTATATEIKGSHKTGKSPHYLDEFAMKFTDQEGGTCVIQSCSVSQSTSVLDSSTNYCNVHNLYTNEHVKTVLHNFATTEHFGTCLQHDSHDCH
eukprot:TRINITY_DN24622_c0_g1_i1.p1 TRINITY_DN24622_c0_g1~~TRINITY_DN24622_c0_g1_i1.p1  ORF type:complete len:349 (+),score=59.85 TRINITY_DN24622_c0_g1_i1:46-1047(+)